MATDLHTETGASVTQLVSGIVSDAQDLMKQQLALFRAEMKEDIRKTKEATISLACGALVLLLGVVLLLFMCVHGLEAATGWPEWVCFGIIGGLLAAGGGILVWLGLARFKSFNPLPDESAQALAENVRWIKNPK